MILGNGGVKQTSTYQEDKMLLGYVLDLQKFDDILRHGVSDGTIVIEEKTIIGIEDRVFGI